MPATRTLGFLFCFTITHVVYSYFNQAPLDNTQSLGMPGTLTSTPALFMKQLS